MKATRIHYFYAQDWPTKIWFGAVMLLCVMVAVRAADPTVAALNDWWMALWLLVIIAISLLIGFFSALVLGWFILGPLYYDRMLKNGGPFKVGDLVQILAGHHRGRVVRVYSLWKGDAVRVVLGEKEEEAFGDVFSPTELLKERDAELSSAPDGTPAKSTGHSGVAEGPPSMRQ